MSKYSACAEFFEGLPDLVQGPAKPGPERNDWHLARMWLKASFNPVVGLLIVTEMTHPAVRLLLNKGKGVTSNTSQGARIVSASTSCEATDFESPEPRETLLCLPKRILLLNM